MHKDKDPIVKAIQAAFEDCAEARRESQINNAFLFGRQHIYFDSHSATVRDLPAEDDQYRVTANRLLPSTRMLMAMLTRRPLSFEVLPEQADDASARASRLAESVIRSRLVDADWEALRKDLTWALWIGGTAALALDWDPAAGRSLGATEIGRRYGTGDCVESALRIEDFALEPGAASVAKAKWWVRCEALPPETVKERYSLKDLPSADANGSSLLTSTSDLSRRGAAPDLTNVYTHYARPCGGKPGKVHVVVGDAVVERGEWPFPFNHLNVVVARDNVVPSQWRGRPTLTSAVPIQAAFNASFSSLVDHTRRAGNARALWPASVMDMLDELTDQAGQNIAYPDGAEKPEWFSPPQLANYVLETPDRLANELDNMLSLGDVTRGDAPGRVDSALGLSILTENQSAPLSAVSDEVARAFGALATMLLETYAAKVRDKRAQNVRTKPGAPAEKIAWTGKDLLGHTRARVPYEALAPKSRAAGNAMAVELLQGGVVDAVGAARLIELPGDEGLLQVISPHRAKAARENHRIAAGHQAIPMDLDNAEHAEAHLEWILSEAYETADEDVRDSAMSHYRAHQAILSPAVTDVPGPLPMDAPPASDQPLMPPPAPMPPPADLPPMPPPADFPDQPGTTEADLIQQMLAQQGIV